MRVYFSHKLHKFCFTYFLLQYFKLVFSQSISILCNKTLLHILKKKKYYKKAHTHSSHKHHKTNKERLKLIETIYLLQWIICFWFYLCLFGSFDFILKNSYNIYFLKKCTYFLLIVFYLLHNFFTYVKIKITLLKSLIIWGQNKQIFFCWYNP